MTKRKRPVKPARRPQAARSPRPAPKAQARSRAAVRGWETRRRNETAKRAATAARVKASKHGERARKQTDRRLTDTQRAARKRDARRVTQKVRRQRQREQQPKKAGRNDRVSGQSFRSGSSQSLKARSKKSTPRQAPNTETFIAGGQGDPFSAQIAVRFLMPAGFVPTRALVAEAIRYRIEHGQDAPRVRTKILRWRNPGRRMAEDRAWRQGNQEDAWSTLGAVIRAALGLGEDSEPQYDDLEPEDQELPDEDE